jgi:hypothetical protein
VERDQVVIKKEWDSPQPGFVQLPTNGTGSSKMVLVCDVRATVRRANPYRLPYSGRAKLGKARWGASLWCLHCLAQQRSKAVGPNQSPLIALAEDRGLLRSGRAPPVRTRKHF